MKKISLFRKLLYYFLIVIILSLTSVVYFSTKFTAKEIDQQVNSQMTQIVNNALNHTDLYLRNYERSIVSLLSNRDVKMFLDLTGNREDYEYFQYRSSIKEFGTTPLFIRNPEISTIYIISFSSNAIYYFNDVNEQSFSREEIDDQLEYFVENTSSSGKLSILNSSILQGQQNQMLTLVRQIRGLSSPEAKGILAFEIKSADLSALWQGIDMGENGYFFITDNKGQIVYHPENDKIGTTLPSELEQKIEQSGGNSFVQNEDGVKRVFLSKHSEYSGWNLVASMPMEELRKPISNIRTATLIVGLFTLLIASWLAYRFGRTISGPIEVLKEGMRETEKGNWVSIPLPEYRDEVVELMERYNLMVTRLSELVEKVYEVELRNQEAQMERQKAEFQSLQLQINPHFLYNSLETIVCYAVIQDSEEISEIVKALAYMLRYSVQTDLEQITVANELKHVMYFLVVLKHRIGREFEIDVQIHPDYLLKNMVRLTLQPLVENVFKHAFPEGVEDYHYIRIDAGVEEGYFWVSVEDNGVGISPEKLAELREKLSSNRLAEADAPGHKESIGILNVHRRIQMVFGEEYGLRIESEVNQGTKMIMVMPESK